MKTVQVQDIGVSDGLVEVIVVNEWDFQDPETGDAHETHLITFSFDAVVTRMHGYGFDAPAEAVEAIVREHGVRLHGIEPVEHEGVGKYRMLGGLHPGVEVTWASGTKKARDAALKKHGELIKQTYERMSELVSEGSGGGTDDPGSQ